MTPWFEIEMLGDRLYRVRLKWWRPDFWFEAYRTIRESGSGPLASVYYTITLLTVLARASARS